MTIKDLSIADLCGLFQYTSSVMLTEKSEKNRKFVFETREIIETELVERLIDILEIEKNL